MNQPASTQVSVILRNASGDPLDDYKATFDVPNGLYPTADFELAGDPVLTVPLGEDGLRVGV